MVTAEEYKQSQMVFALEQQESAFELFKKYTAPKTLKILKGSVTTAETTLNYQTLQARTASRAACPAREAGRSLHDPCAA